MGLRLGVIAVVVVVGVVAGGAVVANATDSAVCTKRRGYGPNDKPPQFYNYWTTGPGATRHVKQSRAMSRVLLPIFTYPDATVQMRFDTLPSGWHANLAFHAACDASGAMEDDWGYLGWEVMTDPRYGGVACGDRTLNCFAKKRLNLGGRIVTRLTPRGAGYDRHPFYTFTSGGLTYWVNGRRPRSGGWTEAQHSKWVEGRIRTARRVG